MNRIPDHDEVSQFFEKYGPSARECYEYAGKFQEYRAIITSVINKLDWEKVASIFTWAVSQVNLGVDDTTSDKVILIVPEFRTPFSQTVTIITEEVLQILKTRDGGIRQLRPLHFRKIFSIFYSDPRSHNLFTWMFEAFVKGFFEARRPRKVFEMEEGSRDMVHLLYTANLDNIPAKTAIIDLSTHIEAIHYAKMADVQPREDHLYIPKSRNEPMFVISKSGPATKPVIWLFECTTAGKRDIKVESFSTLRRWSYPIHYVAVIPGDFSGGRRTFTFTLPKELRSTVNGIWVLPIGPNDVDDH